MRSAPGIFAILLVAATFALVPVAGAQDRRLFTFLPRMAFVEDYDYQVARLRRGSVIELEPGIKVVIERKIAEGNSSLIFAIQGRPDAVLRLPLEGSKRGIRTNQQTILGETLLNRYAVPHMRVLDGHTWYWSLVERLPANDFFTYAEFNERFRPNRAEHRRLLERLGEFALETAIFVRIGDLHGENIVYSKSRGEWLVMDWDNHHVVGDFMRHKPRPDRRFPIDALEEYDEAIRDFKMETARKVNEYRQEIFAEAKGRAHFDYVAWVESKLQAAARAKGPLGCLNWLLKL